MPYSNLLFPLTLPKATTYELEQNKYHPGTLLLIYAGFSRPITYTPRSACIDDLRQTQKLGSDAILPAKHLIASPDQVIVGHKMLICPDDTDALALQISGFCTALGRGSLWSVRVHVLGAI